MPWLCDAVDVSNTVRTRTADLVIIAREAGIRKGCVPPGTATGCLYLVSWEHDAELTQAAIATAVYVSTVTAQARWYEIDGTVTQDKTNY